MKPISFAARFLVALVAGAVALALALVGLVSAGSGLKNAATPLGDVNLTIRPPAARSVVYDRFGNVMTTFFNEDRAIVKLKDIPQVLIDAVISIEDRKFYEHNGVDWAGTTRALFKNVDAGGVSQGGSTITQQLVKNTLTGAKKRDLKVKIREAILAIRLEHELSKDQILEDYLNLVYFGNGAYGVKTAVERYFPTKTLKNLSLAQAALLAGLIQAPEALNPIKHPDAAARRRSEVLDAMVQNGKISAKAAKAAKSVPLPTKVSYPHTAPLDYYVDEVKNVLLNDDPLVPGDPGEVLGATQQARANAVFRGGLKIYTSYDPAIQLAATASMNAVLPKSDFTASLVVIDNADGGVRAIANGRTFQEMQFDPATEGPGRQAGSSFKAFTLATALSRGYSPNDVVRADPLYAPYASPTWNPLRGDCHGGTPTLIHAIAISDNCAFVRTEMSIGPGDNGLQGVDAVTQTASSMGIDTSRFVRGQATTLGTNGVHPLEMAQAYSVFPNDGVLKRATFVTKIVGRNGSVLYHAPTLGTRVLDENVARSATYMMKQVLRSGTASSSLGNFPRPAAGKTGTTDNNVDAWFVGYTPQYTAAVWMGNPDGEIPMRNVGGITVFGATYPARIWRAFMEAATAPLPPIDFAPPNMAMWPRASFIDEHGRRGNGYISSLIPPFGVTTTTQPSVRINTPTPTSPRTTPPVTNPPVTSPPVTSPPATTPPSTGPPNTAPTVTP